MYDNKLICNICGSAVSAEKDGKTGTCHNCGHTIMYPKSDIKKLNRITTGGTIKHLNQNILVEFPVVMPKKDEQEKIGRYFMGVDTLITLQKNKLEKLKNLKKSMLQRMFV